MKKIKSYWNNLSDAKKSALAYMAAGYIHYAISFLVTPIFSRLLSTSEFGLVTTYNSWISMMGPVATLTLYSGFFNIGMLDYENSRDSFESSLIGLSWISTALSMAAFMLMQMLKPEWIDMPLSITVLMLFYFLFYPSTRYWQARERFEYKYKKLFICAVAMALLTPISGLLFVFCSKGNLGVARLLGTNLVSIGFGIFFCIYIIGHGRTVFNQEVWKVALKFCIPLIPHYLAMHILSASDKVMINSMVGASEAGIYGMAYTASMAITTAWTAIQGSLSPYVLKHLKSRDYRPISKAAMMCITGFSALCIGVCVVAPEIIQILGGEKYTESIKLVPPLIASVLFMEMYNLFSMVEFYHKKTTAIMFATVMAALLNVVLNVIFIRIFGFRAAAYTTLVCYMAYCLFHYLNMRKIEPAKIYNEKILLIMSAVYLVLCFGCLLLYNHPILRYSFVAVLISAGIWQRRRIKKLVSNLLSKRKG